MQKKILQKQPLLLMLLYFIAGILMCDQFHLDGNLAIKILVISVFLQSFIFIKRYWLQKFKFHFVGVLFFSAGFFAHFLNSGEKSLPKFHSKQNVVFQLSKKLNSSKKYRRYEVEILKIEHVDDKSLLPLNVVISIPKDKIELNFNNLYQVQMYLNKVEPPNNDFQFDYSKYLARQHIFYQGFVRGDIFSSAKKSISFPDEIRQKRLEVIYNIHQSSLADRSKEFLKGIILADRTEMDAEMVSDFSKSGMVHFLAISGSHMVIIFWLVIFFLKQIFPARFRKISIILALLFIWLFSIFIDFGSSVMRSCIMISAYYTYVLLQRKPDLLHAMALAGFSILIFDTNQLFDVGFQLSFCAVLGIFWLNQPILKLFPQPKYSFQKFFINIFTVSISAQIATLPLVVYYFHQYSLVSVVANMAIIPFSEIIIIFSLLMTILLGLNINIEGLNMLYNELINILLKIIHEFANIDFLFFKNIPMSMLELVVLFVAIYFLRKFLNLRNPETIPKFFYAASLFLLLRMGLNFYQIQCDEILIVHNFKDNVFLVKQGEKAYFFINGNKDLKHIEKSIISPYLSYNRISKFDVIVLPQNVTNVFVDKKWYHLK